MEQTVLSINDDKMTTRGELVEYPAELIGGRNYIKSFTNSDWKIHSRATIISETELVHVGNTGQGGANRSTLIIELIDVGSYTISGYTKGSPDAVIVLRPIGGVGVQQTLYLTDSENYEFFKRSFTINEPVKYQLEVGGNNLPTEGLYFKDLKLEKGSIPTDWTPAPEDLGLSYPNWVTEFKPSISENGILAPKFDESGVLSFSINRTTAQEFIENPNL